MHINTHTHMHISMLCEGTFKADAQCLPGLALIPNNEFWTPLHVAAWGMQSAPWSQLGAIGGPCLRGTLGCGSQQPFIKTLQLFFRMSKYFRLSSFCSFGASPAHLRHIWSGAFSEVKNFTRPLKFLESLKLLLTAKAEADAKE